MKSMPRCPSMDLEPFSFRRRLTILPIIKDEGDAQQDDLVVCLEVGREVSFYQS